MAALIVPFGISHLLHYLKLGWGIPGTTTTWIQSALLRRYLNYSTASQNLTKPAQDGYCNILALMEKLGNVAVMIFFQFTAPAVFGKPFRPMSIAVVMVLPLAAAAMSLVSGFPVRSFHHSVARHRFARAAPSPILCRAQEDGERAQRRRNSLEYLLGLLLTPSAAAAGGIGAGASAARRLRGKTAVVTGASRGIGKGIAVALGEAGAKVFVTGRRKNAVEATAALATRAGGEGVAVVCDHAVDEQVKVAFTQIQEQTGGKLDILVNNAFQDPAQRDSKSDELLGKGAKFFELPLQVWDDVHRVGLRSHYVASYYAAPLLLNAASDDWRPLVCVTSAPAAVTYYYATAYGVAKAGSDRLVRDLQVELGPLGIDCVSIWPGVVYTEFVQSLYEKGDVERINRVTGGRDPNVVCESPLLTGRVIGRLAEEPGIRKPPLLSSGGLTSRVCVVAEGARDLGLRDGGLPGTVAAELYGPDREPAASIRSLGYLLPAFLPDKLPPSLRWLVEPGGPLASKDIRVPFDLMAQDPRTEDPRKQDLKDFAKVLTNTVSVPD
ncbi:Dhrs1 [Symbiodinium necroappetens]|uniref:Dhrs1 protein n=1 Tax=Symbiodinium necroappetens TaxID=1628268 RepID=A0A813B2T1_9DINO|nr:Dhrs1 [Symbiodinium necroappetens]